VQIGIELGEARVTAVAVDADGRVQGRGDAPVSAESTLPSAARSALDSLGALSAGASIGLAAQALESPAVAETVDALRQHNAAVAPPVHSGTAAAVAEAWVGAANGSKNVVFFAVGDHTSGGVVHGGQPFLGTHGRAASTAWLALNPVEREDYRKIGCLEAEVAASGIVRRLIWRIKAGDRSRVQDIVGDDLSMITVDLLLDAARNGDGVSISVVRDTAKYLGMAAANLAALIDPEALVLGGIMASSADLLFEPIRVEVGRRLPKAMFDSLTIVPASLGAEAAAIGAARLAAGAGR
jgi:predicted NBD/HSP70 family sugar kinase